MYPSPCSATSEGSGSLKKQKPTMHATQEQVKALEAVFIDHPRPSTAQRQALAEQLGRTLSQVTNWFQSRRRKEVRHLGRARTVSIESRSPDTDLAPVDETNDELEEMILFESIVHVLPELRSLYQRFPDINSVNADDWAQALDIASPPHPPSIIHNWLGWRRARDGIKSIAHDSPSHEERAGQLLTPISASPNPCSDGVLLAKSGNSQGNRPFPLPDMSPPLRHVGWRASDPLPTQLPLPGPFSTALPSPITPVKSIHDTHHPENIPSSSTAAIHPSALYSSLLSQKSSVASLRRFVRSRYPDGVIFAPPSNPIDSGLETTSSLIGAQSQAILASISSIVAPPAPNALPPWVNYKA
ncbi:hypothetical protein BS47DRAFT_1395982 [Hydnum rufescens UP504]|uniref:Homeobox domain-containing protein n=1 Tax=Hydnum rufescens UP504 TaxID=1448309 RepID=A0A9P6DUC0_9AGAM|nr:hypothetical protein BS47DRAFT_1395982 [Hydnum rufescens UP504]